MYCRSISSLIYMFMAVSFATLYRDSNSTTEWSTTESVREPRQGTSEELGALLDAGDGAVVILEAGGTRLAAHRAVLAARSPVLESVLRHYSVEAGGRLSVPGVEGPVLRHLVAYLYSLRAPRLSAGTATQLLVAAHRLGLPDLQADCERQVASHLSVETAASAAVLAVKHSANHLRDAAVNFIKDHRIKVLATKGWADAVENQPEDAALVSHLLAGQLAEICAPATMEVQTATTMEAQTTATMEAEATASLEAGTPASSLPHSDPSQSPATAAPRNATCPTAPLDEDAVSRLRSLSEKDRDSRLIQAAEAGAVEELRALLAAGADVEARDKYGRSSLHAAALWGYADVASCLLGAGAQVDATDNFQRTALRRAAGRGHAGVVRLLLAASADPNARDSSGSTPLHFAAMDGKAEAAAALLEAGADRGATNAEGRTPLDYARSYDYRNLIEMLTQH